MTDNTGRDHVRAEEDHPIPELRLPALALEDQPPSKRNGLALPRNAFEINHLLSAKECDVLVKVAEEGGFSSISWEYDPTYRCCTRLVVKMPDLAAELWRRVRPHLHPEDVSNARPFGYGIGENDVWRPYGIYQVCRWRSLWYPHDFELCNTEPIALHRDGPFVLTDEERSVYTLMVYLNDSSEYIGGETTFAKELSPQAKWTHLAPDAGVVVRGGKGQALLFEHNLWHEGRPLSKGVKYILRTDLMFVRIATVPMSPALRYLDEAKYIEAEKLFQESIRLQKAGDPGQSTTAYLAALDIHASLARVKPKYGPEYSMAPLNIMIEIFALLPMATLVHCVSCVSRGWCALARHTTLWKKLYRSKFRHWYPPLEHVANPVLPEKTSLKDWYFLYRSRHLAAHHFKVVYLDIGSLCIRYGMLGNSDFKVDLAAVLRVVGHYWTAGSGLQQHECGTASLRWPGSSLALPVLTDNGVTMDRLQILLRWVLLEGFQTRLVPQEHPMLIARPPEMTDANCTQLGDWMRMLLGVPCVAWVHPAICTLAALSRHSGLVLSVTHRMAEVTAVHNEEVVTTKSAKLTEKLQTWNITPEGFRIASIPEAVQMAWVSATVKLLTGLVQQVLVEIAEHTAKADILAVPCLRGIYGAILKRALESELSSATSGVVTTVSTTSCERVWNVDVPRRQAAKGVSLPVTTDIVCGLQVLCGSIERAQKHFALIESPTLKFNKPLLLTVSQGEGYLQRYMWRSLTAPERDGTDAHDMSQLLQIKAFDKVADLQSWWHTFREQLAVATRTKMVRILWSNGPVEDMREMVAFKKAVVRDSALLMIWVDFDSHWDTPEKARLADRELGIYWVHSFNKCPPPSPGTFVQTTADQRTWQKPLPDVEVPAQKP